MRRDEKDQTPPDAADVTANIGGGSGTTPSETESIPFGDSHSRSGSPPATRIKPPRDYPDDLWHNDGLFAVEVELRPYYVAEAEAGTGSIADWRDVPKEATAMIPNDDGRGFHEGPLTYELFAHVKRRNGARHRKRNEERAAEQRERDTTSCAVCHAVGYRSAMKTVRVGDVAVTACAADAAALELELRSREALADGRTRADAVRAAAERLIPHVTAPVLELRSEP